MDKAQQQHSDYSGSTRQLTSAGNPCHCYTVASNQTGIIYAQAMDKAQRQHLDNVRTEATEERQRELAKTADQALHALAPIYSLVVLNHSTYKQVSLNIVV